MPLPKIENPRPVLRTGNRGRPGSRSTTLQAAVSPQGLRRRTRGCVPETSGADATGGPAVGSTVFPAVSRGHSLTLPPMEARWTCIRPAAADPPRTQTNRGLGWNRALHLGRCPRLVWGGPLALRTAEGLPSPPWSAGLRLAAMLPSIGGWNESRPSCGPTCCDQRTLKPRPPESRNSKRGSLEVRPFFAGRHQPG